METFGGEWFHTKDAAVQDEDGYIWYVGRADDVIIAGLPNRPVRGRIGVPRACRCSRGGSRRVARRAWGNVVKAFIVLADGYEPSEALTDEIKSHVRERLSAYAYPRRVEFVPELPKTLTGKIRRVELRQLELERAARTPDTILEAVPSRPPLNGRQPARPPRHGHLPFLRGELDLPQAHVHRRHLDALVLCDELERLLEREQPRRN